MVFGAVVREQSSTMKKIGISYFASVSLIISAVLAGTPLESHGAAEVVAWGNNTMGQTKVPDGLSNVVAISAGNYASLALTADGRVTPWGLPSDQTTISALSNIVAVSEGGPFGLALTDEGKVLAWGSYGSGPGLVYSNSVPEDLSNVVAIATDGFSDLALTAGGRLAAWGGSDSAQTSVPEGLSNVVAIAAGSGFRLALTAAGRVVAWGDNTYGQTNVPANLSNVVAVAGGWSHCLALTADGRVVAWGDSRSGATDVPPDVTNAVAIAASTATSLVLTADGRVVGWGNNTFGQAAVPGGLGNVVAISAGANHSVALRGLPPGAAAPVHLGPRFLMGVTDHPFFHRIMVKNGATAYGAGQLPPGLSLDPNTGLLTGNPSQAGKFDLLLSATNSVGSDNWTVTLYINAAAVPGIPEQELVLTRLGTPVTYPVLAYNEAESFQASGLPPGWTIDPQTGVISGIPTTFAEYTVSLVASNRYGIGQSSLTIRVSPVVAWGTQTYVPTGLTNVIAIAAGNAYSLALTRDGHVTAWGAHYYGQTEVPSGLSNVVAIAAGSGQSLALTADGQVVGWGQFGLNGATVTNRVPDGLSNVVAIAAGGTQALALKADGSVVSWGYLPGNAGDVIPAPVPNGLSNVVAIAAGDRQALALTAQGEVLQWPGQTNVPRGLTNVVAIAAGSAHSLALTADGRVIAWGNNFSGQTNVPNGLSNVVAIAAQAYSSLALTAQGQIVAWGKYYNGTNYVPVSVPNGLSNVAAIAVGGSHFLALQGRPPGVAAPVHLGVPFLVATADQPFYDRITVLNGATAFGAAGLPAGLTLNPSTGLITGQPTATGKFEVALSATNAAGADSWTVTLFINGGTAPGIASHGLVLGRLGTPFTYSVVAYNQPDSYSATGLPAGWAINPQTGVISGVPVEFGDYAVSLVASNRYGVGTNSLAISVPPVLEWTGNYLVDTIRGLTDTVAIAAGSSHSLALTAEGRVLAWGSDSSGQIEVPANLSDIVAIAAGGTFSLALTRQGQVVAWGRYYDYSSSQSIAYPVPSGLTNVVAIAAGGNHSLALTADGGVVTWGQIGDYTTSPMPATTPVGLSNVVAIAAGVNHSLALTSEGRLVSWGVNSSGQTVVPSGLSNVVAIAAGGNDSLALTADGRVVGWGATPVPSGLSNVVGIAIGGGMGGGLAGCGGGLALTVDGRVEGWGWIVPTLKRYPLAPVPSDLTNVVAVAAGGTMGAGPNCLALRGLPPGLAAPAWVGPQNLMATVGRPFFHRMLVRNWADTYAATNLPPGLVLDSSTGLITGQPEKAGRFDVALSATNHKGSTSWSVTLIVNGPPAPGISSSGVVLARLGLPFNYTVVADNSPLWFGANGLPAGWTIDPQTGVISGTPVNFGDYAVTPLASNEFGLGTGSLTFRVSPVVAWGDGANDQTTLPSGLSNVVAIATGAAHSLALTAAGQVIAWGSGTATNVPSGLSRVVAIAAGADFSLALTDQGRVVAWGETYHGQTNVPPGLSDVVAIAAGDYHALALRSDGQVVAWGAGSPDTPGSFDNYDQGLVPSGLNSAIAIAAGGHHSLGLTAEGQVVAWGLNRSGQTTVPEDLSNVVAIAAGESHSLALTAQGQLVAWGDNSSNQCNVPIGLTNVVAIAASGAHSLALTADGRVVAWGQYVGPYPYPATPVTVPNGLSNVVAIAAGGNRDLALIGLPPGGAPPAWAGPQFLIAAADRPYQHQILVRNGADSYTATGLPPGLALNPRTGLISGQPTQPGRFTATVSAANQLGSSSWTLTLVVPPSAVPGIASSGLVPAGLGLAFNFSIQAHNLPESYGASGLPPGLAIDPQTGLVWGVSTENGDFEVSLLASNRFGTGTGSITVRVSPVIAWGGNTDVVGQWMGQAIVPAGLSNIVAVAAGDAHSLALTADGRVVGWGDNSFGQATPPVALRHVVAISAGVQYSLALTQDGRVVAWGRDWGGTLNVPSGLSNVVAIAAGWVQNLALTAEGRVVLWPNNMGGPLDTSSNIVAIAAGRMTSLALTSAGQVVGAGTPGGASNIVAIAAGQLHYLALTDEGQVVAWGNDQSGQTDVPVGLSNVIAVAAGGGQSLALTAEGRVVAWGRFGTGINQSSPIILPNNLSNVVAIAAGEGHGLALLKQPNVAAPGLDLTSGPSGIRLQAQGAPGIPCLLLRASQLPGPWLPAQPVTFTNSVQSVRLPDAPDTAQFFRLLRK